MKNLAKPIGFIAISLSITGCLNTEDNNSGVKCNSDSPNMAIQTVAPDFSSSAIAVGCSKDALAQDKLLVKDASDFDLSAGDNVLYHLDKTKSIISQYDFQDNLNGDLANWEYTVNDSGTDSSVPTANPYKILEASSDKAYVIRYNKLKVWIVNPQAKNEADFKIGELDLSKYAATGDQDGQPVTASAVDMSDAVIANNKLFIAMQRIRTGATAQGTYGPYDVRDYTNDSKVAVFDIKTDKEIGEAITLQNHNVSGLQVKGDLIFANSRGDYFQDFGGLDIINSKSNTLTSSFNASDEKWQDLGLGFLVDLAISGDRAYILGDKSKTIDGIYTYLNTIFKFDLSSNEILEKVEFLKDSNIPNIETGPQGNLWVSSAKSDNPGVYKLDFETLEIKKNANDEDAFIATELNPDRIIFKQ